MRAGLLVAVATASLAAFCALPASADEVLLKNGFTLKGRVDERGDQLVVHTPNGRVWVAKSQVDQVIERTTDGELFERRRAALLAKDTPDLDGRVALGKWAIERGLHTAGRRELKAVLKLDPDHAGARAALGYVPYGGTWVTPDERKRLLGFVRDAGEWVTTDEAELRRAKRTDAAAAATAALERERIAAETRKLEAEARAADAAAAADRLERERADRWYRTVIAHSGSRYRHPVRRSRRHTTVARDACGRPLHRHRHRTAPLPADAHTRLRTGHQHPSDPHTRLRNSATDPRDPHTRLRTRHDCEAPRRTAAPLITVSFGTVTFGTRR